MFFFFFFKQKTAYEMRISDWSSDVCSSDLNAVQSSLWFGAGNEGRQSILGILPLFHVFAMTVVMNWSMRVGGEMILLPRLDLKQLLQRSEERRVGKECVSTCRSRWSPTHEKTKNLKTQQSQKSNIED